jgi:hypothetical protein
MSSQTAHPLLLAPQAYDTRNEQQFRTTVENRLKSVESITDPSGVGTSTIADNSVTFAKLQDIATDRLIGRDTAGTGDPEEISVGNGLQFTGSGGVGIANAGVTFARMQNIASDRLVGRDTASSGAPEEISLGAGLEFSGSQSIRVIAGQIPGTATNDSASAGNVGQYTESVIALGDAVSLTSPTPANMTSISLTAGDWDVDVVFQFTGNTTTTVGYLVGSLSTTTAAIDSTAGRRAGDVYQNQTLFNNIPDSIATITIPPLRFLLSSTTTIYAVAQALFATSTCAVFGILRARRVR